MGEDQPVERPGASLAFGDSLDGVLGHEIDGPDEDGTMRSRLPVRPAALQVFGLVHGGTYATMAETLASVGTHVAVGEGRAAVGLSNHTSFLRPVTEGTVHAVARPRHRGRTTWVWEVELTDDEGRLCALSRVTIAVR
jgi:1,4-dihydroxy-2-naphthoyl-CoA hydrolase